MTDYIDPKGTGVGRKRLPSRDSSRYSQVRLTITRTSRETGIVSVVARSAGGGLLTDTRLYATEIPLSPGSRESQDALWALRQALQSLMLELEVPPSPAH